MNKGINIEKGIEEIMAIIGDAGEKIQSEKNETVYDGQGHVLSVGGKKTTTGYVKGKKRITKDTDIKRRDLLEYAKLELNRVVAFTGKVYGSEKDGVIVRMVDADYSVKVTAHTTPSFASREEDFIPSKSFVTRGKTVNHSSAIAKVLTEKIENQIPGASFCENEKSVTLLEAKASGVRFEMDGKEYSFKIVRKRSRVVCN